MQLWLEPIFNGFLLLAVLFPTLENHKPVQMMCFNIAFQWRKNTRLKVYMSKARGENVAWGTWAHKQDQYCLKMRKSKAYDVTELFTSLNSTGFCAPSSDFMLKYCVLSVEMLKDKWQPVMTVFPKMETPRHKLIKKDGLCKTLRLHYSLWHLISHE